MVVDTSALTCIIVGEPEREAFSELLLRTPALVISVASVVETSLVLRNKRLEAEADQLDELLQELRIEVRSVDREQGVVAREAFERFGRGRHPAKLNFGDCFTYALAKLRGEPLLYKGSDFALTDIPPAWTP